MGPASVRKRARGSVSGPVCSVLRRGLLAGLPGVFLALLFLANVAVAAAPDDGDSAVEYTRRGADTCLKCHDSDHVQAIFRTPHGQPADSRTPFAKLQCETCHGPGGKHAQRVMPGEKRPAILTFGSDAPFPVERQNAVCLSCHQRAAGAAWPAAVHRQAGVACADCHTVHAVHDSVLTRDAQPTVCYTCHKTQRAQFQRAFHHPVREGQMACSDCHKPHKSLSRTLMAQPTVNQTCYTCHADKRGPFLWEHPPAAEDCTLCHNPHGSNHRSMLSKAAPLLCQDCHSRAGHPSTAFTGNGLPGRRPSQFVLAGSCTNCHSRVHGSNSPSGAELFR